VPRAIAILGAILTTSLIGCGAADSRATAEISRSITNGTMDDGDPAVVALLFSGQAYCTGTVIAGRWVLTAAHCAGGSMIFNTGFSPSNFVPHAVDAQTRHPSKDLPTSLFFQVFSLRW